VNPPSVIAPDTSERKKFCVGPAVQCCNRNHVRQIKAGRPHIADRGELLPSVARGNDEQGFISIAADHVEYRIAVRATAVRSTQTGSTGSIGWYLLIKHADVDDIQTSWRGVQHLPQQAGQLQARYFHLLTDDRLADLPGIERRERIDTPKLVADFTNHQARDMCPMSATANQLGWLQPLAGRVNRNRRCRCRCGSWGRCRRFGFDRL
jgi:hypothetical protein